MFVAVSNVQCLTGRLFIFGIWAQIALKKCFHFTAGGAHGGTQL